MCVSVCVCIYCLTVRIHMTVFRMESTPKVVIQCPRKLCIVDEDECLLYAGQVMSGFERKQQEVLNLCQDRTALYAEIKYLNDCLLEATKDIKVQKSNVKMLYYELDRQLERERFNVERYQREAVEFFSVKKTMQAEIDFLRKIIESKLFQRQELSIV